MRSDASANKVTLLSGFYCMRALSDLHETIPPYNKNCRTRYVFICAYIRGLQRKDAVKRSGCVNSDLAELRC